MKRLWAVPFLLVLAAPLWAEKEPGRGVARVSLTNGDITMQRGDSGDWIAAAVNAPLVTGDKIVAARASRAEVQFDAANFLRLGENTEVRIANLDERRYQLEVSRGVLTYRVFKGAEADVEINTPAVAVRPLKPGVYRIEVQENGQTAITVRDGKAEVVSRQGAETLSEGRTMVVRMGPTDNEIQVQEARASGHDDWDQWNERRDQQLARSRSYRYVDRGVYGVEDLDDYGRWETTPDYGGVWYPRVAVGWAPYTSGRWVWVDWYGWTWVDYSPWGWAPFHYGRWFFRAGFGWGWWPGPMHVRSYWAPALVGFFGWGGRGGFGVGAGFGYGNVGWVPLAPHEAYYPWYGRGGYGRGRNVYINNSVNITNITNIRNVYRNANVSGGINSVDVQQFGRGGAANARRVDVAEIRNAGQIRGLIPVVPDRSSLRFTDREARAPAIPRAESPQRFFTRTTTPAVERVPFAEQQQQIARSIRGLDGRRTEAATGLTPAAGGATPAPAAQQERRSIRALDPAAGAQTNAGTQATGGWRRAGENNRAAPGVTAAPQSNAQAVGQGAGWRRLGQERPTQPAATVTPQPNSGATEQNSGWRRIGRERSTAPAATATPQPNVRTTERDSGGRRFGQIERQSQPPSPRNETVEPRGSIRGLGEPSPRMESPRSQPRSESPQMQGGGRRQLEINRPIVTQRAPRSEGTRVAPERSGDSRSGGGHVDRSSGAKSRR